MDRSNNINRSNNTQKMFITNKLDHFIKKGSPLLNTELLFLSLMIISLPSLEGPKNIFLVLFVITAASRQIKSNYLHTWGTWDWIFISFIGCALLSTVFAGFSPGSEWQGFRMLLTYTISGWLVSRSKYSEKEVSLLFWLIIIGTIPPLLWGLSEYFLLHTKHDLQLHSVGHVNHSAIYLTMIFGACVTATLSLWKSSSSKARLTQLSLSILFFASLVIGQSRAALGIGLILAISLITLIPSNKKIKWTGIAIIAICMTSTFILNAEIIKKQQKFQEDRHDILNGRNQVWNVPLEASRFHPILGIGMNNWKLITLEDLKRSVEARNETFEPSNYLLAPGHAHNLYLQVLLERGALGLISIFVLMLAWLTALFKSFKFAKSSTTFSLVWGGSLSAWTSTFGIGFANSTFHHEHAILACTLLALHLCLFKSHGKTR